jgi:hypothetical protein
MEQDRRAIVWIRYLVQVIQANVDIYPVVSLQSHFSFNLPGSTH